ncbi:MAG: dTMP kinase [Thermoplasmatota archaeon]
MKQFITFEGIDGSGKSTISKKVFERLQSEGYKAILTNEPTDTTIGRYVKHCIKTGADPYVTAFTFIADRIQHCAQIKQWIEKETIVLCDRYAESTYAYQGAQLEEHLQKPIFWLQELSKDLVLKPDRTFLFVISPKTALSRIQNRPELIEFEQLSFLEKVHKNYLEISKGKRFLHVDATKKIDELVTICCNDILS